MAWCLQTWWGSEVVVSISMSLCSVPSTTDPVAVHLLWFGHAEILSTDRAVINALEANCAPFISSLTADRITCCTSIQQPSHPKSLHMSAASPTFARSYLPHFAHLDVMGSGITPSNPHRPNCQTSTSAQRVLDRWNALKSKTAASKDANMNMLHDKLYSGLYAARPVTTDGVVSLLWQTSQHSRHMPLTYLHI